MNIASHRRLAEGRRALVSRPYRWLICLPLLIGGCATHPRDEPYSGPVAKPQVAYRIDDHRFFEVVPREKFPCDEARLYYTDTAKDIHTNVVTWDRLDGYGEFIIDAANDQYLVTPIVRSSSGCQTGGGDLCASRLYYSVDSGRTWKENKPQYTIAGDDVYLIDGTVYYAGRETALSSLETNGNAPWKRTFVDGVGKIPPVRKMPVDRRLHCNRNVSK